MAVEEGLIARGASPAPPEEADVVLVNTCSVTASADQGARQAIRRVARVNPSARIIVTGCYATRRPGEIAALPNVARVVANDEKPKIMAFIGRQSRLAPAAAPDDSCEFTTAQRFGDGDGHCGAAIEPGVAGRTAFTLRVQTGCGEPCSYCIIPSTRGVPRSMPLSDVVGEVERIVDAGFKEIALTGVHLGSYGRDLTPPSSLAQLLEALAAQVARPVLFRISSLEPMDCSRDVVALVAERSCFAPHFHLPLQHASDRMLAAMRRPYTIGQYASLVSDIRSRMPHAAIGSDVIVGFPGESEIDFEQHARFLENSPLTHLHVFPYSDRPGTAASTMGGRAPGDVVRERARRIRGISEGLSRRFRDSQVGTVHRALTLDDGSVVVTGNYLKLGIPPGLTRNQWVRVRVLSHHRGELLSGGSPIALDNQLAAGRPDIPAAALPH